MNRNADLRELDRLFQQALSLPSAERSGFMERACQGQQEVEQRLRRLLEAHTEESGVLGRAVAPGLRQPEHRDSIGRWKLLEPIGAGGFGLVYSASCEADGVTLH